MSLPYEEIVEGMVVSRLAPGPRHELICTRLHTWIRASVANLTSARLLAPRSPIQVSRTCLLCPDLALLTTATNRLWLAAEIVSADDHRTDTVVKKEIYEAIKVPRLWMIGPRYDNVEVYHSTPYGLALKGILSGREMLQETALPEFALTVAELFAPVMA